MLSVIISVSVALLTIVLNAAINIRIKFAPDATAAAQDLKELALRIFSGLLTAYLVFDMYRTVTSTEPVTRFTVLGIAAQVAVMMLVLISFFFKKIFDLIERLIETMVSTSKRHFEITQEITQEIKQTITRELSHLSGALKDSITNPPDKNG